MITRLYAHDRICDLDAWSICCRSTTTMFRVFAREVQEYKFKYTLCKLS